MRKCILFFILFFLLTNLYSGVINLISDANFLGGTPPAPNLIIDSISPSFDGSLVGQNTIVFWDFTNPNASGNEIGLSGTGQSGNLVAGQSGTITGAVNTSPFPTGYADDGWYRTISGTQYFQVNQKFLNGSLASWTLDFYILWDSDTGIQYIYDESDYINTNNGISIRIDATNELRLSVADGSGGFIIDIATTGTLSPAVGYHVVAKKDGSNYTIAYDTSRITDISSLPASQRNTGSSAVDWGTSTFDPRIGSQANSTTSTFQGKFSMGRILNLGLF